jgi:hypothetical protein
VPRFPEESGSFPPGPTALTSTQYPLALLSEVQVNVTVFPLSTAFLVDDIIVANPHFGRTELHNRADYL